MCPALCTSNGSVYTVVQCLPFWQNEEISDIVHTWVSAHPLVPNDHKDPVALTEGLLAAHLQVQTMTCSEFNRAKVEESKARLRNWFNDLKFRGMVRE